MKINKVHKKILFMAIIVSLSVILIFSQGTADAETHKVTKVTPASFTDQVEFYGNIFEIDNTYTALCLEREKGTPQVNMNVTLSYMNNPDISKILYYGYGGPARWNGFSGDGEAILVTSIMLSDTYSGLGYRSICDNFRNFLASAPNPPDFSMSFSPESNVAFTDGDEQRTEQITLIGDNRLSVNLTLGDNMTLHFSNGITAQGTVTLHGGDKFYITAPLSSSGEWSSGNIRINETMYSTILVQTESENIQSLAYLVPNTPQDSGGFTILWYDKGYLEIFKKSDIPSLVHNNQNYSLEGAVYNIYDSYENAQASNNPIQAITTDTSGYAKSGELKKGIYYIRESVPPKGYRLSDDIVEVNINTATTTTVELSDTPIYMELGLVLKKTDSDNIPLANAEFEIAFYTENILTSSDINQYTPAKIWIFKTDSLGQIFMDNSHLISGDPFYTIDNINVLPQGTITIKEITAPYGYLLDDNIYIRNITEECCLNPETFYTPPCIINQRITKPFEITKYGEDGVSNKTTLSGAGFMVCPVSKLSQDTDGNYIWDPSCVIPVTSDGTTELFTNEKGYAISAPLPYGTYLIRETTVPKNYVAVPDFLVTIGDDTNNSDHMIYLTDKSFKAYIQITKEDSNSHKIILDNPATFKIWSFNQNSYVCFEISNNLVSYTIDQFQTDANGTLITPEPLLPGKYLIEEITPPEGYRISSCNGIVLDISDDLDYELYSSDNILNEGIGVFTITVENSPITGQIKILKTLENPEAQGSYITKAGIEFNIYSTEDILSPDGNGTILYNSGDLVETIYTDENGIALSSKPLPLGTYKIVEANVPAGYIEPSETTITFSSKELSDSQSMTRDNSVILDTVVIQNNLKPPIVLGETYTPSTGDNVLMLIIPTVISLLLLIKIKKKIK